MALTFSCTIVNIHELFPARDFVPTSEYIQVSLDTYMFANSLLKDSL